MPLEKNYPPIRTGMRGAHPGSFEAAHGLAREGRQFGPAIDIAENYDLAIVGAGISGLTAAYAYRKKLGPDVRILILDNHDDFGGHAKRNEFNQGGRMRLSWGGTMNMEYHHFSQEVKDFLKELGIDVNKLADNLDFHYGGNGKEGAAIYFDAATYGRDVIVTGFNIYGRNLDALDKIDEFPISQAAKTALKQFYRSDKNILEDLEKAAIDTILYGIPYTQFLSQFAKLPAEAIEILIKGTDGYWGIQIHSLSVAEAMNAGMPGSHLLGTYAKEVISDGAADNVAMFPDGNASIARLLIQALIPDISSTNGVESIATAQFDYSKLDLPTSPVRVRLSSTVINVSNSDNQVDLKYIKEGKVYKVKAKHTVLACYHSIISFLCPELPET
jgi:spermidine dehydrogenase